jgi:hypothetical protein
MTKEALVCKGWAIKTGPCTATFNERSTFLEELRRTRNTSFRIGGLKDEV